MGTAVVPADPLVSGANVEPADIVRVDAAGSPRPVDDSDRALILARTVDGLEAMGTRVEVGRR